MFSQLGQRATKESYAIQSLQEEVRSLLAPETVHARCRRTGCPRRSAQQYPVAPSSLPFQVNVISHVPDSLSSLSDAPNWSQLRSTPMSFLPSRSDSNSFSTISPVGHRCPRYFGATRSALTIGQIEQLRGGGEHLRWQLRYRRRPRLHARRARIMDIQVFHVLICRDGEV